MGQLHWVTQSTDLKTSEKARFQLAMSVTEAANKAEASSVPATEAVPEAQGQLRTLGTISCCYSGWVGTVSI